MRPPAAKGILVLGVAFPPGFACASIHLSGLLFPIEGMPTGAQYLASVIPLTYFPRIVRGTVLGGPASGTCGRTSCRWWRSAS